MSSHLGESFCGARLEICTVINATQWCQFGVPIGIGTEMQFLLNSTKLIEVLDSYEVVEHRLDMRV
jgi:hypothetical protein